MAIYPAKVTPEGQVTIPVAVRERLQIRAGDTILLEERDGQLAILHPDHSENRNDGDNGIATSASVAEAAVLKTAGIFKDYAYTDSPDPAEERRWVGQHIAETADCYDE